MNSGILASWDFFVGFLQGPTYGIIVICMLKYADMYIYIYISNYGAQRQICKAHLQYIFQQICNISYDMMLIANWAPSFNILHDTG